MWPVCAPRDQRSSSRLPAEKVVQLAVVEVEAVAVVEAVVVAVVVVVDVVGDAEPPIGVLLTGAATAIL